MINLIGVAVAAITAFILGFLFHGPLLGKVWMKLANVHMTGNEKITDMIPRMAWNFFVNIVTAYVLAVLYLLVSSSPFLGGASISTGIFCGLLAWIGFLVTSTSINVIWMGASLKLWLFESACSLVVMASMGAIIAAFAR
jgi:hypothetical protein